MEKSKVYFTDMHTHNSISLPDKLKKLIKKAGIGTIDMEDKFVAIKIHFGDYLGGTVLLYLLQKRSAGCAACHDDDRKPTRALQQVSGI